MVFQCCVPNCNRSNKEYKLHSIPTAFHEEWLRAIDRVDLLNKDKKFVRTNYRVCDAHFREDQKVPGSRLKSNLKKNAIPALGLQCETITPVKKQIPYDVVPYSSCAQIYKNAIQRLRSEKGGDIPMITEINSGTCCEFQLYENGKQIYLL